MSNEQWGVEPGTILKPEAVELIKSGTEYELYAMINMLGKLIWSINQHVGVEALHANTINELVQAQYGMEFAVLSSRRFGTEISDPKPGEHVERTDSYNAWYRWWDQYIQHELSGEQWLELNDLITSRGDHSKFRPSGVWKVVADNNADQE